jgi:hypothetical protein
MPFLHITSGSKITGRPGETRLGHEAKGQPTYFPD